MAGAAPDPSTAAGQQYAYVNVDHNNQFSHFTVDVQQDVQGASTVVQQPILIYAGDTPGPPLARVQSSRQGNPSYFQHLENWTQLSCLERVRDYTIDKIATQSNSAGRAFAHLLVLRNAETHIPLFLIRIHFTGEVTMTNLDGSVTILTANNCLDYQTGSAVFEPGLGQIGVVANKEILNKLNRKAYVILHVISNWESLHFVVQGSTGSPCLANKITALPSHQRVLIQLAQDDIGYEYRALILVAALRFYHRLAHQFTLPKILSIPGANIHQRLFDEVCKLQYLPMIELPSRNDVQSNEVDMDVSKLSSVTEAVMKFVAMCPKMYKRYYFIENAKTEEILFVGEESRLQATLDFRFRHLGSNQFVFLFEELTRNHSSPVFLGNIKIGSVVSCTQVTREFSYEEMLTGDEKRLPNGNHIVKFERRFEKLCSTITINFSDYYSSANVKFEGTWDIYWKALIFSYAAKMFIWYTKVKWRYANVSGLRDVCALADSRNSTD